jgi:hypothetical protein
MLRIATGPLESDTASAMLFKTSGQRFPKRGARRPAFTFRVPPNPNSALTDGLHIAKVMKAAGTKNELSSKEREELLKGLKNRFEKNMARHEGLAWAKVEAKLEANAEKLWSLHQMEKSGGEPDVVSHDKKTGEYVFFDCSPESPKGRFSLCYDREALDSRKEHKPKSSAMEMASAMGIELLTEAQYHELQQLGTFDTKSSSWLKTPAEIRKLGGAIFGDRRFGRVFVYHNGAQSYYSGRGFRGSLRV